MASNQPEDDRRKKPSEHNQNNSGDSGIDFDAFFNQPSVEVLDRWLDQTDLKETLGVVEGTESEPGKLSSALENRLPAEVYRLLKNPRVETPLGTVGKFDQLTSVFELRNDNGEWLIPDAEMLGARDSYEESESKDDDENTKYTATVDHQGKQPDDNAIERVHSGFARAVLIQRSFEDGGGFDVEVQVENLNVIEEMLGRIETEPDPKQYSASFARYALDRAVQDHIKEQTGGWELNKDQLDYIKKSRDDNSTDEAIRYNIVVALPSTSLEGNESPRALEINGLTIKLAEDRLFRFQGGERRLAGLADNYPV